TAHVVELLRRPGVDVARERLPRNLSETIERVPQPEMAFVRPRVTEVTGVEDLDEAGRPRRRALKRGDLAVDALQVREHAEVPAAVGVRAEAEAKHSAAVPVAGSNPGSAAGGRAKLRADLDGDVGIRMLGGLGLVHLERDLARLIQRRAPANLELSGGCRRSGRQQEPRKHPGAHT